MTENRFINLFLLCLVDYPYVRGSPKLTFSYNEDTRMAKFQCQFARQERSGVSYLVNWKHQGNSVSKVIANDTSSVNSSSVFIRVEDINGFSLNSEVRS